jgi:hypothetical protein
VRDVNEVGIRFGIGTIFGLCLMVFSTVPNQSREVVAMALQSRRSRAFGITVAALAVATLLLPAGGVSNGWDRNKPAVAPLPPCPVTVECCPTRYNAGTESEDLKVHVVGAQFDVLELYFRHNFYRDRLPGAANLHCTCSVVLAPKNEFGTLAVRYGQSGDKVRLYGWRTNNPKVMPSDAPLDPGYPATIEWVTSRIVKIHHGPNGKKSCIVRFEVEGDVVWNPLFNAEED